MSGATVTVLVDRPLGSAHPDWPNRIYPVNYGYVPGIMSSDGEEQDAYILGVDRPLKRFSGQIIAVIRRLDDAEDKWVVAPEGRRFSREEICRGGVPGAVFSDRDRSVRRINKALCPMQAESLLIPD